MIDKYFSKTQLLEIFQKNIQLSKSTGLDGTTIENFKKNLDKEIDIIHRKILAGTYTFTNYKEKLISKGADSKPRQISIPTVRDKIVLKVLTNILTSHFRELTIMDTPQKIINDVKNEIISGKHSHYIKLDISNFYPSIKHDELLKRLWRKIRDPRFKKILIKALKTPTGISKSKAINCNQGVPQGLSISNILAAMYLMNIDKQYKNCNDIAYFRYVDDTLILYNKHKINEYKLLKNLKVRFKRIGLNIHDPLTSPHKSSIGKIKSDSFTYLGYAFMYEDISVRQASIQKFYNSLVNIFVSYKNSQKRSNKRHRQTLSFLEWRLNIRITGCIFENKSRGWLFFFSEINDEQLIHRIDYFIKGLISRFNLNISCKNIVKAYKEITLNLNKTKYIPNFDKYSNDQKINLLNTYFDYNYSKETPEEKIDLEFKKRISKQVRDLLEDIQSVS